MIARLTGLVVELDADRCVIDVGGVGYLVLASTRTLAGLARPPDIATLLIETQVREDAITLHGFATAQERELFRVLTTLQGVGARLALGVLSAFSPDELVAVIAAGDRASLLRAQGVGPRLADRILAELRGKLASLPRSDAASAAAPVAVAGGIEQDALSALAGLGFRRVEAHPVLARVITRLGAGAGIDAILRETLRELSPRG